MELQAGDALGYRIGGCTRAEAVSCGDGTVEIQTGEDSLIWVRCKRGSVLLERIEFQ